MGKSQVRITPQSEDYAQWYLDICRFSDLYESSSVPGCMVFLPRAVDIWNAIRKEMGKRIKAMGVSDVLLPMMIPVSYMQKEADHVEGFAPELLKVTHVGDKKLSEEYTLRPTSEMVFSELFKKRLRSYKDLPILYNQWVNTMRWEKRTRPFLRTSEFYWQEGHTIHETHEDANEFLLGILHNVYVEVIRDVLAIDGLIGEKSKAERFPGALNTYTYEPMMNNGWALQSCTAHLLSQNFMKTFDVHYQDARGKLSTPFYTSWGASTRLIGGIISSHADDNGLILPPKIAAYKAVILPMFGKEDPVKINDFIEKVGQKILGNAFEKIDLSGKDRYIFSGSGQSILVDGRDIRLGEKINDFELTGYPIRIEIGPRDIANNVVVVASRITQEKVSVDVSEVKKVVQKMLNEGHDALLQNSRERLQKNTIVCETPEQIGAAVSNGKFALYAWDEDEAFETEMKNTYKATTRCMPFSGQFVDDMMPSIPEGTKRTIFARAF